jgi:hypothetical protein
MCRFFIPFLGKKVVNGIPNHKKRASYVVCTINRTHWTGIKELVQHMHGHRTAAIRWQASGRMVSYMVLGR